MYVCMHVCMHACMYNRMHACMYVCITCAYVVAVLFGRNFVSSRLLLQQDGYNCGVWIQVARDFFLRYMKSDRAGTRQFFEFFEAGLQEEGVRDVNKHRGAAKRGVNLGNSRFIQAQRNLMRERLLHAAELGTLQQSHSTLVEASGKGIVVDLTTIDDGW